MRTSNRLLISVLFVALLGMLGTSLIDYLNFKDIFKNSVQEQQNILCENVKNSFENVYQKTMHLLHVLSSEEKVEILTSSEAIEPEAKAKSIRALSSAYKTISLEYPFVLDTYLTDLQGKIILSSGHLLTKQLDQTIIKQAQNSSIPLIQGPIFSKATGELVLVASTPVNANGKINGFLFCSLSIEKITENWSKSLKSEFLDRIILFVDAGRLIIQATGKPIMQSHLDQNLMVKEAMDQEKSGFIDEYVWNKKARIGAFTTIEPLGWKVLVSSKKDNVLLKVKQSRNTSILISLVSVSLTLLIIFLLLRRTSSSLRKGINLALSEVGEELAISQSSGRFKDEASTLYESLKIVLSKLHHSNQQLEELLQERTGDLRSTQDRLALLLNSVSSGIVGVNNEGRFEFANPAALKILGYEEGDLPYHSIYDVIGHNSYKEEVSACLTGKLSICQATRTGKVDQLLETTFCRKDGSYVNVNVSCNPVQDGHNEVGSVIIFRDISESLELREYMRVSYRCSFDFIWIFNMDGHPLDCSDNNVAFFRVENKARLMENFYDFSPVTQPNGMPSKMLIKDYFKIANKEDFYRFEWLHISATGEEMPCEVTLTEITRQGQPAIFAYVRDLRPLKKTEERLKNERRHLQEVLDASPIGIIVIINEHYRFLNKIMKETFNLHEGDLVLKGIKKPENEKILTAMIRKDRPIQNEGVQFVCADGSKRDYLLTTMMTEFEGDPAIMAWLLDVTEIKNTEAELVLARDSAQKTMQDKIDFLARMSHEIRTPLNGVIGLTHLALMAKEESEPWDYLEKIYKSGRHLLQIINDILDFSKSEAGKMEISKIPFALSEVINNMHDLLHVEAVKKGLTLEYIRDPWVPEHLLGDPLRIRQILLNLLSNALKFTNQGKVTLSVKVSNEDGEDCLLFTIQDTGVGMPQEQLKLIFDPFYQADNLDNLRFSGTGLGLPICRHLTELMGGKISTQSVLGQGSTFKVTLPIIIPSVEQMADMPALQAAGSYLFSSDSFYEYSESPLEAIRGMKVLLAEDNYVNQQVALEYLTHFGLEVDLVSNGLEAVKAAEDNQYSLILMDIMMPEMDGLQATKQIRSNKEPKVCNIPIIAMTASARLEDRRRSLEAGMNDHINKPIDPNDLCKIILSWIAPAEEK